MDDRYLIQIFEGDRSVFEDEFQGPIELGRQVGEEVIHGRYRTVEGRSRVVVAPRTSSKIARRHALIEPIGVDRVRISNLSMRDSIAVRDAEPIPRAEPGGDLPSRVLDLPAAFDLASPSPGASEDVPSGLSVRISPAPRDAPPAAMTAPGTGAAVPPEDAMEDGPISEADRDEYKAAGAPPTADMRPRGGFARRSSGDGGRADRHATVRYYSRMNVWRAYPLLVAISKGAIREVVKARVEQRRSAGFQVPEGSMVEVEPILPGCDCYPPRASIAIDRDPAESTFWVVPIVPGRMRDARVVLSQGGERLATVPIAFKATRQRIAVAMAVAGLLAPLALPVLQHYRLDLGSQLEDGFGLYGRVLDTILDFGSAEAIGLALLLAAAVVLLLRRPKRRDVFWDLEPSDTPSAPVDTTDRSAAAVAP